MKHKSPSFYLEVYGSYILGVITGMLAGYFFNPRTTLCNPQIFDKSIDIGGILFGFLLTILTLLIQTDNSTIRKLRDANRFKDLVSFNKEVVFCCIILFVYSFFLLIFAEKIANYDRFYLDRIVNGMFISIVIITALKVYKFTKIFYQIIS